MKLCGIALEDPDFSKKIVTVKHFSLSERFPDNGLPLFTTI